MAEKPGYGGFKPEEIINEKDRALGGDSAYWENGGRGKDERNDTKGPVLEKLAEEVKKIEENPPKVEEGPVESVPAPAEKERRVYKKRAPKNAPFEEVTPEQEVASLEEVLPEEQQKKELESQLVDDEEAKKPATDEQKLEKLLKDAPDAWGEEDKVEAEKSPALPNRPLAEGEPADPNFDYEKALNDHAFLDFLTKYSDAEMVDPHLNRREIENRHRVYEAKNMLGAELAVLYTEEVAPQFGLPMSGGMSLEISGALESEAIENPDNLIRKAKELEKYSRLRGEVKQKNQRINELVGSELAEDSVKFVEAERRAHRERSIKEGAVGWRGFFNVRNSELVGAFFLRMMPDEERQWHEQARSFSKEDRKLKFSEIKKKIDEFSEVTKLRRDSREAERFFADLRKEMVSGFIPTKLLFEEVQRRAGEALSNMLNKAEPGLAGFRKIADAQEYLERLKTGKEKFRLEDLSPEVFQREIDERLGEIAQSIVRKHVADFKIASEPLRNMLAGLYDLINKEQNPNNRNNIISTTIKVVDESIANLQKEIKAKKLAGEDPEIAKMYLLQVAKKKLEKAF